MSEDRGTIYPAGIASVWADVRNAVEFYERVRKSAVRLEVRRAEDELVRKWKNLQDSILNYEPKAR